MAEKDSTTINPVAIMERLQEDYAALEKAKSLMDALGAIAYQAMLAGDGGQYGKMVGKYLRDLGSPWEPENLQESTFQVILKLAGEAWRLLNECANPEYLFSVKESGPEPPECLINFMQTLAEIAAEPQA